jgi:hypothetical protein
MPLHTRSPMLGVDDGASVRVVSTVRDAESTAVMTVVRANDATSAESETVYIDVESTVRDWESTLVMTVVTMVGTPACSADVG